MAARVVDSKTNNKHCVFCGLPINSSQPNILCHAECNRTLKAHYAREVKKITGSMSKTLGLIDRFCHG